MRQVDGSAELDIDQAYVPVPSDLPNQNLPAAP